MGKGQIISGGEDGYYTLTIDYDDTRKAAEISRIDAKIALFESQIETLTDANAIARRRIWIAGLQKRKAFLSDAGDCPTDETVSAWCADLTETLSGTVGTIEINSVTNKVLIRPGYEDDAEWVALRDGQMQAMLAQHPAAALLNYMFHDGRQKWKPRYRVGTITAVDSETDTCNLTLDEAAGQMSGTDINISATLSNVAVDYMTCNSRAFAVEDRVVVEFNDNDWDDPVVIGFESNPKACDVYLQISINESVCSYTLGNKWVRIVQENESTGEMEAVGDSLQVITSDLGICGPFEGIDLERPFYAELYYRSTNFFNSRQHYWFPYFEVGTSEDYTFHLRTALFDTETPLQRNNQSKAHLNFSNGDTYPMTTGDIVESKSWYLKRVEWLRSASGDIRSVSSAQAETEAHGSLRVLPVNFECKVIRWKHTGWTYDVYSQEVYEDCAAHGDVAKVYPIANAIALDTTGDWNYFAAFVGDEADGTWDRLGDLYFGLPDVGYSPTVDITEFWNSGGNEWFAGGNSFLKYWGSDARESLSEPPFIISDENGGIISTPENDVVRVANILQYAAGYCVDWDYLDDCIEYSDPCGGWVVVDDDERHEYTFEIVDLPEDFI